MAYLALAGEASWSMFDETDILPVGAALWAADIEAKNTAMMNTTAPDLREAARTAE